MKEAVQKTAVNNKEAKDNGGRLIFDDPILCAQFLRDYSNIGLLKNVQPEDIEDISERFLPMWQGALDSDSVKKIRLRDIPQDGIQLKDIPKEELALYLITIIEHQSNVHFDMAFRILRYIVVVLTDYESEQNKLHPGITKTKEFKYPPILPIIYYEGTDTWTAVRNFKDRVHLSDLLGKYIPGFEYLVVPLRDYTNQDLIARNDQLSLLMLINKLRSSADFKALKDIPEGYLRHLAEQTPEYLLELISRIVAVFLYRLNLPR